MAKHTLTQDEIVAIRNALAAVLADLNKKSPMIDATTDDPDILDPLHASFAQERKMAEGLMDLLDRAEVVELQLPD